MAHSGISCAKYCHPFSVSRHTLATEEGSEQNEPQMCPAAGSPRGRGSWAPHGEASFDPDEADPWQVEVFSV